MKTRLLILLSLLVISHTSTLHAEDANEKAETVAPLFWMGAMNVFRRHEVASSEMFHFYGEVLGFEQLGTFAVGNGGVSRFRVGASELKLTGKVAGRTYIAGGVEDATGVRLLSFFFPDQQVLEESFAANMLPVPQFQTHDKRTSALVQDPDGQWLELVVKAGMPEDFYRQVEVGLTVSDLAASQEFYGNFVGLEEMPAVYDSLFDTMKYSYRNGATIISLRSFGTALPADTGSGGIQYVVTSAAEVDRMAQQKDIVIDQPLSELEGFSLLTIWLDDPDGITNYFAQTGVSGEAN